MALARGDSNHKDPHTDLHGATTEAKFPAMKKKGVRNLFWSCAQSSVAVDWIKVVATNNQSIPGG